MIKNLTVMEYYWLVGIIEGEGNCSYHGGTQVVRVKMNDLDTIKKVSRLFTKISGVKYKIDHIHGGELNHGESFHVGVYGKTARVIMEAIHPDMSLRRRGDIYRALRGDSGPKQKLDTAIILQYCMARKK